MKSFLRGLKLFGAFLLLFFGLYTVLILIYGYPQPSTARFPLLMPLTLAIAATILWMEWKND